MAVDASKGPRSLLAFVELGGYPDFRPLYERLGYSVTVATSGRKAVAAIKRGNFDAVVAEFNLQREFRDRTSSLESILAALQGRDDLRLVVLFHPEEGPQLEQLRARFPAIEPLPIPVDEARLTSLLADTP